MPWSLKWRYLDQLPSRCNVKLNACFFSCIYRHMNVCVYVCFDMYIQALVRIFIVILYQKLRHMYIYTPMSMSITLWTKQISMRIHIKSSTLAKVYFNRYVYIGNWIHRFMDKLKAIILHHGCYTGVVLVIYFNDLSITLKMSILNDVFVLFIMFRKDNIFTANYIYVFS